MEFLGEMLTRAVQRILDGDAAVWSTVWRTLRLALISTGFALILGVPLGVWLGETSTRARRWGTAVANAGLGLPPVVLGIFVGLALRPGGFLGDLEWLYSLRAMVLAQTLLAFPIVVALTAAAVAALPSGLLDQARAFGASRWRRGVLAVREARVGLLAAVIAAMLSALAEVGAVILVGGNSRGSTNTLASTVILDLNAGDDVGATAQMLILITLVIVVGGLLTLVQQRAAR